MKLSDFDASFLASLVVSVLPERDGRSYADETWFPGSPQVAVRTEEEAGVIPAAHKYSGAVKLQRDPLLLKFTT